MKDISISKTLVKYLFVYSALLFISFNAIHAQTLAKTYFIDAEKGNDRNDGMSVAKPFKTIAKAKQAIQLLDKTGNDITVNLRGGIYFQNKTEKLSRCCFCCRFLK